jgi:pyruvate kinase
MNQRKAKIVATIGPSSSNEEVLGRLINAGLDVARLNFSHGTHQSHGNTISLIRRMSEKLNKPVSILIDLQGPKLRVGRLPDGGIPLKSGQSIILKPAGEDSPPAVPGSERALEIPMDVPDLLHCVSRGNRILLDDGHLELEVSAVGANYLQARVVLGGVLKSHKGVNLPGAMLNFPAFTEKDHQDLIFGLQQPVDIVAISFIRKAEEVAHVRRMILEIDPSARHLPLITKLELPEAIENLEEILAESDGVMVARGDLAVETSPSSVPIIQKNIIEAANRNAKIVITATQMLDSMIYNPRPTRAEASDVANAIFDGTDAVMLSGETASGNYPVESVEMMAKIVVEAEAHYGQWGIPRAVKEPPAFDDAVSITRAARELAHDRNVAAIAVFTESGRTAMLMAKARPGVPIFAFTPDVATFRRLGLYWGVTPMLVPYASTLDAMLNHIDSAIIASTNLTLGDQLVMISGFPVGAMRPPNFALLHTIGESI